LILKKSFKKEKGEEDKKSLLIIRIFVLIFEEDIFQEKESLLMR